MQDLRQIRPGPDRYRLLLLVLIWLAFALRVSTLTAQSLWRDEVDALRFATQPLAELLAMFRRPGENGPLYFLAIRPWLSWVGRSEFALRFPSAWWGTLAAAVACGLVARLYKLLPGAAHHRERQAGALAMLLMATGPYLVWYGQEAKMYALLTALVPLGLLLAFDVSRFGGWWRWVLLYLLTTFKLYIHLLAVLAVPVQMLWLLLLPAGPLARRRRLHALVYLAILILPYLPLAWWQLPAWLSPTWRPGQPFVPLVDIFTVLAVAFTRGILPVTQPGTLMPLLMAVLSGLLLYGRRPGDGGAGRPAWLNHVLLLVWLLVPPLEIYGVSLGMPIFLDRYLIWVMPAFLILAALGMGALARAWRPLALVILGAALAFNLIGIWAQTGQPIKADFRSAAHYLTDHRQPEDWLVFQIPYNRYTFAYYGGEDYRWVDGPFTNNGAQEAAVAAQMSASTRGARSVWLVESEVALWDERGLTRAWLDAYGHITDEASFTRVTVTRYELGR